MKAIASLATVLLLLLAGVGLVACGDDDDDTAATEATTTEEAAGGGAAADVSMTEYAFKPKHLTVSPRGPIIAKNDGQIDHNYTVLGGPANAPTSKREIGPGTDDVAPGTTDSFPTDFTCRDCDVICTIPGHAEKGMKGTLTIKGSPP